MDNLQQLSRSLLVTTQPAAASLKPGEKRPSVLAPPLVARVVYRLLRAVARKIVVPGDTVATSLSEKS